MNNPKRSSRLFISLWAFRLRITLFQRFCLVNRRPPLELWRFPPEFRLPEEFRLLLEFRVPRQLRLSAGVQAPRRVPATPGIPSSSALV